MDNSRMPKKSTGWKIPWKKACCKTTTEVGRQHHEGLLVAAEYKRMERKAGDRDTWRRNIDVTSCPVSE
jgi:hypothetical protein